MPGPVCRLEHYGCRPLTVIKRSCAQFVHLLPPPWAPRRRMGHPTSWDTPLPPTPGRAERGGSNAQARLTLRVLRVGEGAAHAADTLGAGQTTRKTAGSRSGVSQTWRAVLLHCCNDVSFRGARPQHRAPRNCWVTRRGFVVRPQCYYSDARDGAHGRRRFDSVQLPEA